MFSKTKPDKASGPAAAMRSSSPFSILGPDVALTGNIQGTADLHVEGRIEGDVTCHDLVQGEGSEIVGAVRAETVRLSGTLRGSVMAREVTITATARVEGDVFYDALIMEQGALLAGQLKPNGGHPALDLTRDMETLGKKVKQSGAAAA